MLKKLFLSIGLLSSVHSYAQINSGNPSVPFGSNTTYEYGIMPTNLPTSGTYSIATDAANAYNSFVTNYIEACGDGRSRVKFDTESETVSEGIAYTMLLAAYAADQNTFDELWSFYKSHRNNNGVMNWKVEGCDNVTGQNGATDAEVDASMALIIADVQWGSSGQTHDYKSDAITLINIIQDVEVNQNDLTFENGDVWKPGDCRNPSYQAPAYARVWAQFLSENGQESASFWNSVATATENLHKNNSTITSSGLASNWSLVSGTPSGECNGSGTSAFSFGYDACRAPWRQGIDYLWHGDAATGIQGIIETQIDFWINAGGASQVQGGDNFSQSGSGSGDHNGAFLGMVGAQSLASSSSSSHQTFVDAMYSENKNAGESVYFSAVLRCLGLFAQTGNFWNPYSPLLFEGNTSPTVTITSPSNGSQIYLGTAYTITATATDSDGSISKVEFYEGNTLLGTDDSAPYSFEISTPTVGTKTYTAKAYDDEGKTMTSSPITVSVLSDQDSGGEVFTSEIHAAIDDFDDQSFVFLDSESSYGMYWWTNPNDTYTITRSATDMTVSLNNASTNYDVFGLNFGEDKFINLQEFSNANIKMELENNTNSDIYFEIQLRDVNGNKAEIFNADASTISWSNRWQKIGVEILQGQTFNGTLDLSSTPNQLGGLSALSWFCSSAVECPLTSYDVDISKISEIIFIVNGGAGTEDGNPKYTEATGDLVFKYFSIGEIDNANSNIIERVAATPDEVGSENVSNEALATSKKDAVYLGINIFPNPAKETIRIEQNNFMMNRIKILDGRGVQVMSYDLESGQESIDINHLPTGIYTIVLFGNESSVQHRVVIK